MFWLFGLLAVFAIGFTIALIPFKNLSWEGFFKYFIPFCSGYFKPTVILNEILRIGNLWLLYLFLTNLETFDIADGVEWTELDSIALKISIPLFLVIVHLVITRNLKEKDF